MTTPAKDPGTDLGRLAPYVSDLGCAARLAGEDPYILAAICLRETWAGWAPGYWPPGRPDGWGDKGCGWGLMQVDRRYHKAFVESPDASSPHAQFLYACRVLREARNALRRHLPDAPASDVEHATLSAYNAGFGAVFHALQQGRSCDAPTTGHDYGLDVLRRADKLRRSAPHLFDAREVA